MSIASRTALRVVAEMEEMVVGLVGIDVGLAVAGNLQAGRKRGGVVRTGPRKPAEVTRAGAARHFVDDRTGREWREHLFGQRNRVELARGRGEGRLRWREAEKEHDRRSGATNWSERHWKPL